MNEKALVLRALTAIGWKDSPSGCMLDAEHARIGVVLREEKSHVAVDLSIDAKYVLEPEVREETFIAYPGWMVAAAISAFNVATEWRTRLSISTELSRARRAILRESYTNAVMLEHGWTPTDTGYAFRASNTLDLLTVEYTGCRNSPVRSLGLSSRVAFRNAGEEEVQVATITALDTRDGLIALLAALATTPEAEQFRGMIERTAAALRILRL